MNRQALNIITHVIGCFAFLSFPFLVSPDWPHVSDILTNPMGIREVSTQVVLLLFFYVNYFFLVPRLYFQKQYVLFFLIILIFLAGLITLSVLTSHSPHHHHPPGVPSDHIHGHHPHRHGHGPPPHPLFDFFFNHNLYLFLLVFFISLLMKTSQKWKQTEREKLNAELSYLKAQINPHFLFNTLNSIYSLAIGEKSDHTATAIVKLSGMMRYVISESHHQFVSLEKEIGYISDYIDLQRFRFGNTVRLSFDLQGQYGGERIAPIILIPFIENAFKHGINPEEDSEIHIEVSVEGRELHLMAYNKKVSQRYNADTDTDSGIGIDNTRHRLQLLYPGKHSLKVLETDKDYTVSLHLQLT